MGCRLGLDLALLWLWHRVAATALDSTPSLGASIWLGCSPKKIKKKKKKDVCICICIYMYKYIHIYMYN